MRILMIMQKVSAQKKNVMKNQEKKINKTKFKKIYHAI